MSGAPPAPGFYEHLALAYDAPHALAYAEEMVRRTEGVLAERGAAPGRLVDVACGTGTFALAMAAEGWETTGVDRAPAMLAAARAKPGAERVRWLRADMRDFALQEPADLATCFYDSLNHLESAEDLERTFRRVRAALREGGLFVFDVNAVAAFEALWSSGRHVLDLGDRRIAWTLRYDRARRKGVGEAEVWVRRGLRWERLEDRVEETPFADGEVRAALGAAGFALLSRASFNPAGSASRVPAKELYAARAE